MPHSLDATTARLSNTSVLFDHVVDITDPNSFNEICAAIHARSHQYGLTGMRVAGQLLTACGLFNTHDAAYQLLKRTQPVEALTNPNAVVLLNVAEIAEAREGRRIDHVVVGVAKSGRLLVGYAAQGSPILSGVLPYLDELYLFNTPPEWDRHQTFRSRNVLPRVIAGVLAKDTEVRSCLKKLDLSSAAEELQVSEPDRSRAWWFDGFGGHPQLNLKTAYTAKSPELEGVGSGDTVSVLVNEKRVGNAIYARSLQASGAEGELVLCQGSSGYLDPEVGEVRFLDLMVYRGSAYEVLGKPKTGAQIAIQSKKPALV